MQSFIVLASLVFEFAGEGVKMAPSPLSPLRCKKYLSLLGVKCIV